MALSTSRGELKIVQQPEGTRGYEDLRRAATREPLGRGIRPAVASVDDLARMLAALGREEDLQKLRDLRRLAELELGRGVELRAQPRRQRTHPVGASYPSSGRMLAPLPLEEHCTIRPLPSHSAT
jgi:hypothetical protein